jgi:LPXTG-site transpeptidase (sortase) family protein
VRRLGIVAGVVVAAVAATGLLSYELTPTPLLGHRDPHSTGVAAIAQDVVAQSDILIAQLPGSVGSPAVPAPPPSVTDTAPRHGFWIEMPTLSIALPVQQGDGSDRIPMWKALVYPGTAWPGGAGYSYVYAHAYWGMFGGLLYARPGDVAYLHDYDAGTVTAMHVTKVVGRVPYGDTRWIARPANGAHILTLQTCVDYNPKGDRFIVQLS